MNFISLALKGIWFYKKKYMLLGLGIILCAIVLSAALLIGKSVHLSLVSIHQKRIQDIELIAHSGRNLFSSNVTKKINADQNIKASPVFISSGNASKLGHEKNINVQVIGAKNDFGNYTFKNQNFKLKENQAYINSNLAKHLQLQKGDELLLKVMPISHMPADAPLSNSKQEGVAISLIISRVLDSDELADFQLQSNQSLPFNVIIDLDLLNKELTLVNQSNSILIKTDKEQISQTKLLEKIQSVYSLNDFGIHLKDNPTTEFLELSYDDIFIPDFIKNAIPQKFETEEVFHYFVNSFSINNKKVPYSFISTDNKVINLKLKEGEIAINEWLADDLAAKIGDLISIEYLITTKRGNYETKSIQLKIKKIYPLNKKYTQEYLKPIFPGLTESDSCKDWDSGIPIDLTKIRDKDEKYWEDHNSLPKAYLHIKDAQKYWSNSFGASTGIYIHSTSDKAIVASEIQNKIKVQSFGLQIRDLHAESISSVENATDFSGLFVGLSFFIIFSSLLLIVLFINFHIEDRRTGIGTLLSLGYTSNNIIRILGFEILLTSSLFSILGAFLGPCLNTFIISHLNTIWSDAVGGVNLKAYFDLPTILISFTITVFLVMAIVIFYLKKGVFQSIIKIRDSKESTSVSKKKYFVISASMFLISLVLIFSSSPSLGIQAAGSYGASGFCMILGLSTFLYICLSKSYGLIFNQSIFKITLLNMCRKPSKTISSILFLSIGLFLLLTVGSNQFDMSQQLTKRESGTGGFLYYGNLALPIKDDLKEPESIKKWNLDDPDLASLKIYQFKYLPADDASCVNLNYANKPSIIGIDPNEMNALNPFSFTSLRDNKLVNTPWLQLNVDLGENIIPVMADDSVMKWSLFKSIGDTLEIEGEDGLIYKLQFVGSLKDSIFQGNLLIPRESFTKLFPSNAGSSLILLDGPIEKKEIFKDKIIYLLEDQGIYLEDTIDRFHRFMNVQNTYLQIFFTLSVLGMLLGCLGMGIMIIRNFQDRKWEFSLLKSIGYKENQIQNILLMEIILISILGTCIGMIASFISLIPAMYNQGSQAILLKILTLALWVNIIGILFSYLSVKKYVKGIKTKSLQID